MAMWFRRRALHNFKPLLEKAGEIDTYLEVGLWQGDSFFWVMRNIKPRYGVGIDPYWDDNKRQDGVNYKMGLDVERRAKEEFGDAARIMLAASSVSMPQLIIEGHTFDLVYIDGSHNGMDVLSDAAMAMHLVAPGGTLIFDDFEARVRPNVYGLRLAVDTFQRLACDEFEVVAVNNQVVMRRYEKSRATGIVSRCKVGRSILSDGELTRWEGKRHGKES